VIPKDVYTKALADHITVSVEDLTSTELALIDKAYAIFKDGQSDFKAQEDEVKRLNLELANLKAMTEEIDRYYPDEPCPTCGRDDTFRNNG
jgi:uncharacterized protein YacL (UPF0231 family)